MGLWTDLIDPQTLTGYVRESLVEYEARQGTLARWLPNREVQDIVVRFFQGRTGLIDVAKFRAYDAEPEVGTKPATKRVTLELPALGQNIPASEYEQLRARGIAGEDSGALRALLNTTPIVVRAVADAIERMRGIVLVTGKATIDQDNFQSDDDFGRPVELDVEADDPWNGDPTASRLEYLGELQELYEDTNGATPGAMVMSRRVFRALAQGDEFQLQLANGAGRTPSEQQVRDIVTGAGLPPIELYNRRVQVNGVAQRVIPDDVLLMLPAPVETDAWEDTELGATYWGRTLTSMDSAYGIEASEQPGIVAGVYRHEKPPMGVEVISDAIGLPVLANAELSLVAKVLADGS